MTLCKPAQIRAFLWILAISSIARVCPAQFAAIELPNGSQDQSKVQAVENGVFGGYSMSVHRPGIWTSAGSPFINLGTSQIGGDVFAIKDGRQFGQWNSRATMWSGTFESLVDLQPSWADNSTILAASSQCQVGRTFAFATNFDARATVWFGTAASAVSLHPTGAKRSTASAAWGNRQGGSVSWLQPVVTTHAVLWSGTAASMVDLNPGPEFDSAIGGMFENQQVGGIQSLAIPGHAAIWHGTAESLRDVHPFPDGISTLYATCGTAQVGYVNASAQGAGVKAGIWFGTKESFLNLAQFLPPGAGESAALCVEEVNGVFTVGGYARYGTYFRPFVWVGVPAPTSSIPLLLSSVLACRRRRAPNRRE